MEDQTILFTSLSALLLLLAIKFIFFTKNSIKNLPPSPPISLPFIGHLHLIKSPIHRSLQSLSQKYGPIMSLRFGSRLLVVVSSASGASECLTKNDIVLANRPKSLNGKHIGYNYTIVVAASYGDHWRHLRRIMSIEIFSSSRLNNFLGIRNDEVKRLLSNLARSSGKDFARVELKPMLVDLALNNVMRMVAGKRYCGDNWDNVTDSEETEQFKELVGKITGGGGIGNAANSLLILRWIGNHEKKVINFAKKMDKFLQGLISEHRRNKGEGNTMIDHLLSLQETNPDYYTDQIIKGLVVVMIIAGTDTSAVTLEWAMTNLLNHPEVLDKVRNEIDAQIGEDRLIEESDVANLPYLQSVMWETLRLYPAAPILLPHMSSEDCAIGGYHVPKGTTVLINAYTIHRDPSIWEDAETFKPERFENGGIKESHKLLPFGLGRRACPGAGLAQRIVSLTLGSMIQCFEWKRTSEEKIDLTEGKGTTMPKVQPLVAMCKARPIVNNVLFRT